MACAPSVHESESSEISPEEGGRDSTDVNSGCMVNDLLLLFKEFKELDNTKKEIEEKIGIKLQEHKCWSEDDIKKAWKKAKTMDIQTARKWVFVTVMQVVRRFDCDICKQNAAQKNRDATPEEPGYEVIPDSEDTSSQRRDEPETVGAAGGTNRNQGQTGSVSEDQTETSFPGAPDDQSGRDGSAASERETRKRKFSDTIYIRIPLTKIFGNQATLTEKKTHLYSQYKLIDKPPEKSKQETDEETEETEIKKKGFYVMLFNKEKNHAEWVYEILNKKTLPLHYKTPKFQDDRKDPDFPNPNERNPDYDRGHLAAAANHRWCKKAFEGTYWMSNITPQNKNLNRGAWKQLEIYCRDKIFNSKVHNVHVYTGPLYLKKDSTLCMLHSREIDSEDGKALPTHYFKVLIVEDEDGTVSELECFYIPNAEGQDCIPVDITEIERLSGLMFTDKSPKLREVDYKKETTWKGNKGETSVTIDVSISSYKKNDENPQGLNEE